MKKDIEFPTVEGVQIAVVRKLNGLNTYEWQVYLLNRNDFPLQNAFVTSRGYGEKDKEEQNTSLLRHFFKDVEAKNHQLIEPIDESVFGLNNEYWLSYFANNQLFDKRFIFVPDSIVEANLIRIDGLEMEGILHE